MSDIGNFRILAGCICLSIAATAFGQGPPAALVELQDAESQEVRPTAEFVATVTPARRAVIGSAVDGRVSEFFAEAGMPVTAGDTLAQLRIATIEIELAGAKAERKLRKAELDEMINGPRPEERKQADARLSRAAADLKLAESRLKRAEKLDSSGAISVDELDRVRAVHTVAVQAEIEARFAKELIDKGTRDEQIQQARARLHVQNEQVKLLEDRIKKYSVRTAFSGFVVKEYTEAGAWVKQGDPVAEVIEIDPIEIAVRVPESYISFIRLNETVNVFKESLEGITLEAKVTRIIPDADTRSRTFPVTLRAGNPRDEDGQYQLRPGMLVKAELPIGDSHTAVMVPKDALVLGGRSPVIFKVVEGKATSVPVKLGAAVGDSQEVIGDVQAGDSIVVRGNERLRPGQPIKTQ